MSFGHPRSRRALFGLGVATIALVLTAACGSVKRVEPNAVSLTATDFAFAVAGTFTAGTNEITLTNNGAQTHHGQLIRLDEGKTLEELGAALAEGGEELPEWAHFAGGPGAIDPGQSVTVSASLQAGPHVVICFIPDFLGDGAPHFTKGMVVTLDVPAEPVNEAKAPASNVKISGGDYLFEAPEKARSGKATIAFTNAGAEVHEVAIVRLNEGVSIQDYLGALTAETPEGPPPGIFVGGVQGINPGESQTATLTFEKGSYGLLCFFANAEGVPHFALGMVGQINVD
jgi:plastocyanin